MLQYPHVYLCIVSCSSSSSLPPFLCGVSCDGDEDELVECRLSPLPFICGCNEIVGISCSKYNLLTRILHLVIMWSYSWHPDCRADCWSSDWYTSVHWPHYYHHHTVHLLPCPNMPVLLQRLSHCPHSSCCHHSSSSDSDGSSHWY